MEGFEKHSVPAEPAPPEEVTVSLNRWNSKFAIPGPFGCIYISGLVQMESSCIFLSESPDCVPYCTSVPILEQSQSTWVGLHWEETELEDVIQVHTSWTQDASQHLVHRIRLALSKTPETWVVWRLGPYHQLFQPLGHAAWPCSLHFRSGYIKQLSPQR